MAQLSILPDNPPMSRLRIDLVGTTYLNAEAPGLWVGVGLGSAEVKTRWVGAWPGVETDYLNTAVAETVSAFMYEATPRDVVRAVASVKRQARGHRRSHEF